MRLTRGGEKVLPRAWGAVAERWAGRRAQAEGCSVWYKLRGSALEAWKPCRREGRGESAEGGAPPPLTKGVSGGCRKTMRMEFPELDLEPLVLTDESRERAWRGVGGAPSLYC